MTFRSARAKLSLLYASVSSRFSLKVSNSFGGELHFRRSCRLRKSGSYAPELREIFSLLFLSGVVNNLQLVIIDSIGKLII